MKAKLNPFVTLVVCRSRGKRRKVEKKTKMEPEEDPLSERRGVELGSSQEAGVKT